MAKPNRKRRNGRKADQYKSFKAKRTRKKVVPVEAEPMVVDAAPAPEPTVVQVKSQHDERIDILTKLMERMERLKLSESEVHAISVFAMRDGVMTYAKDNENDDLGALNVDELSEFEFRSIITRANHGMNTILDVTKGYSRGPFFINRGMREATITRARRKRGVKKQKPTTASGIATAMKNKKAAKQIVGLQ